jgi:hypothetical protein
VVSSWRLTIGIMKRRASVVLLLAGMTAAGFLSAGLVRAADDGPDLGESVVVSPSPARTTTAVRPSMAPKTKAEPVKPPSPKPGGGEDDDDDERSWANDDDADDADDDD